MEELVDDYAACNSASDKQHHFPSWNNLHHQWQSPVGTHPLYSVSKLCLSLSLQKLVKGAWH
jgi:hypothetical protein